jgi:molecular chaperone Hsp33
MQNNTDYLIRGLVKDKNIRFTFADTTATVQEGILIHSCDPVSGLLFARALTTAALISPMLGEKEKYSLKWEYDGSIGSILADVTENCEIRGIPQNTMLMERVFTVEELYGGKGQITVIKFSEGAVLSSGTAPAGMLEVCDDIAFYFSTSDQIETDFSVMTEFNPNPDSPVKSNSGFMLQAMPGCDLEQFLVYRDKLTSKTVENLLLDKRIPTEKKLWKILEHVFNMNYTSIADKYGVSYTFAASPVYKCQCSREKIESSVKMLNKKELDEIKRKGEKLKVVCHFCNTEYTISPENL